MPGSRRTTPLRSILQNCLTHIDQLESSRSKTDEYERQFQDGECKRKQKNKKRQFQELKQFSEGLKGLNDFACTEGEKEANRKKNRYKDILPFNVSRVVLSEVDGVVGSSYVNANYIKGASGSPAYIASQGPLANTVCDFWRMVVECEVQVIVMACNTDEAGKHKCENYWVEREDEERTFGNVEVRLLKANVICPDFLVRTMRIKYTNEKAVKEERTVCQFHYSAWPDHGVPPMVRPLLDMVRLVRDTQASETLPVLVHCSAGCGRTGTICAIDFVWGLLRLGKLSEDFSLFNLVRDMRKQRVAMVQTKEQYILVHQAVRELFKEQLNLIDSHTYQNININGDPVTKNQTEPIYETLVLKKEALSEIQERSVLEKSDKSKREPEKKVISAPPLPRKKSQTIPCSKQEKEVENLTVMHRTAIMNNESNNIDKSPSNSLIRKPRIAKLKALFERSSPNGEKATPKAKSHTIARSHSFGPIRRPLLSEIYHQPLEKPQPSSEPPIRSGGKLKVPKLLTPATRPVPNIKRSKSLKASKESTTLLTLLQYASTEVMVDDKKETPRPLPPLPALETRAPVNYKDARLSKNEEFFTQDHSKRRRSLESLIGEDPPAITWPKERNSRPKSDGLVNTKKEPLYVSVPRPGPSAEPLYSKPKPADSTWRSKTLTHQDRTDGASVKSKASLSLKQQFQLLTNASQRKMSSLASGLGIRERRNSFRQAVSKEDMYDRIRDGFGSEGRFISVPEDSSTVFVDGHSRNYKETLTVKTQNGEILKPLDGERVPHSRSNESSGNSRMVRNSQQGQRPTSQSMRITSKNRFLFRLKSELQHQSNFDQNDGKTLPVKHPDGKNGSQPQGLSSSNSMSNDHSSQNSQGGLPVSNQRLSATKSEPSAKTKSSYFLGIRGLKKGSGNVSDGGAGVLPGDPSAKRPVVRTTAVNPLQHEFKFTNEERKVVGDSNHAQQRQNQIERPREVKNLNLQEYGNVRNPVKGPEYENHVGRPKETGNLQVPQQYKTHPDVRSGKSEPRHRSQLSGEVQAQQNFRSPFLAPKSKQNDYETLQIVRSPVLDTRNQNRSDKKDALSPLVQHRNQTHRQVSRADKNFRLSQPYFTHDDLYGTLSQKVLSGNPLSRHPGKSSSASSQSSDNLSDPISRKPQLSVAVRDPQLSRQVLEKIKSGISRSTERLKYEDSGSDRLSSGDRSKSGYSSDPFKQEPDWIKQDVGSESSSSSGARELYSVMRFRSLDADAPNVSKGGSAPWAASGRSKSTSQAIEELLRAQPVAPPRIRRRGSTLISRHSLMDPLDPQLEAWHLTRSQSNDARKWNGALGVDLDAVAASMQWQRDQGGNSESNQETSPSVAVNHRKHQYL